MVEGAETNGSQSLKKVPTPQIEIKPFRIEGKSYLSEPVSHGVVVEPPGAAGDVGRENVDNVRVVAPESPKGGAAPALDVLHVTADRLRQAGLDERVLSPRHGLGAAGAGADGVVGDLVLLRGVADAIAEELARRRGGRRLRLLLLRRGWLLFGPIFAVAVAAVLAARVVPVVAAGDGR